MRKNRWTAGWTRINEPEFKAAIAVAMKAEPDLCVRLRLAIGATAARGGVHYDVRDQYLRWLAEVEAAAMAEAEHASAPVVTPQAGA